MYSMMTPKKIAKFINENPQLDVKEVATHLSVAVGMVYATCRSYGCQTKPLHNSTRDRAPKQKLDHIFMDERGCLQCQVPPEWVTMMKVLADHPTFGRRRILMECIELGVDTTGRLTRTLTRLMS